VVGCCEHVNAPSVSIKCEKFDLLRDYLLLGKDSALCG
jgi:hypothetical protein